MQTTPWSDFQLLFGRAEANQYVTVGASYENFKQSATYRKDVVKNVVRRYWFKGYLVIKTNDKVKLYFQR